METRQMPPPICPTSLHRSEIAESCGVPFMAFCSLDQQQQHNVAQQQLIMPVHQQQQLVGGVSDSEIFRQLGGQQKLENIPSSKVVEFHEQMQTATLQNAASMQNVPVPTSAFDYFSLFLPQQDFFHSFGDVPSSSLTGEGLSNSVQNGGGNSYPCEEQTSSSASSIPAIYSTACSSSSAKTSATASTSSSVTAKSQDRKRPYPCLTCDSRFGSKMELEEHQNSHTGMKPFQCDVCQSRFNRRSTLWNHKRIHSDAKPFKCTVCQMQFKWKNSLKCHKEMHLRKNELSHGVLSDVDSQMLTYATAAKKTMGSSPSLTSHQSDTIGTACPSGAVLPPSAIAMLSYSTAPSRLLTCAGTPRKRAPPKNGLLKGLKVGKSNGAARDTDGEGTIAVEAVSEAQQQQQQFNINLFPFGVGGDTAKLAEMVQLKKEPRQAHQSEELAALRREQALQQRHHQQQSPAGFNLFPLGGNPNNQQHNSAQNTAPIGQQQQFFALNQQMPLIMDQQQSNKHQTDNQRKQQQYEQQQQQQQLDLQLGQLVDPSFLLQDFQLAQCANGGINGQVGMMPFLGFDLQQQLNSLTTVHTSVAGATDTLNSEDCLSSTRPPSSVVASSVSVIFSSPAVVPSCTSSASSFLVPSSSSSSSNCFATNACHSSASVSTDQLLNGYHQQFGSNSVPFLSSATKVQQQNNSAEHVEFRNGRQTLVGGYDVYCTTTVNGGSEFKEFEVRNGGPQSQTYGQHHFTSADQFEQLHDGIDRHCFAHLSGQILDGKQIKSEEQQLLTTESTVAMSY